ncbi:hypothetical protein [Mucilaginibacter agri]|uniref:Uncharacterized protein n=1 Tax=Mucilaginibacter agri TaxID=2695265 RepID=A0A965ZG22_9SPHI|nr:hypothetical protein [Mucilaginibacter agri]NCD69091.1 hypothetical protein [Mucilaginibacter agri]
MKPKSKVTFSRVRRVGTMINKSAGTARPSGEQTTQTWITTTHGGAR